MIPPSATMTAQSPKPDRSERPESPPSPIIREEFQEDHSADDNTMSLRSLVMEEDYSAHDPTMSMRSLSRVMEEEPSRESSFNVGRWREELPEEREEGIYERANNVQPEAQRQPSHHSPKRNSEPLAPRQPPHRSPKSLVLKLLSCCSSRDVSEEASDGLDRPYVTNAPQATPTPAAERPLGSASAPQTVPANEPKPMTRVKNLFATISRKTLKRREGSSAGMEDQAEGGASDVSGPASLYDPIMLLPLPIVPEVSSSAFQSFTADVNNALLEVGIPQHKPSSDQASSTTKGRLPRSWSRFTER